jgi:CPA1 family monovalent cation:H+ antiporter
MVTGSAERLVLTWGGLRGALTITLALALPPELPERQLLISMAFGVVLFTLVVQAVTLPVVVQRVGLAGLDSPPGRGPTTAGTGLAAQDGEH